MKASELLADFKGADFEVSAISDDSRTIKENSIYVAMSGVKADGADYIGDAVKKGAGCVVVQAGAITTNSLSVPLVEVVDSRVVLAELCRKFYQPRPRRLVAVTGTDGKTSVAHFTRQLWEICGHKAASIGTIGVRGKAVPPEIATDNLANTTPGMVALSAMLQKLALAGVDSVVMETSSHGLCQKRVAGMEFSATAFTNLTRDHLDYHGTVEEYFKAKAILFAEVMAADGVAVLNRDDARYSELQSICRQRGIKIISFGEHKDSDLCLLSYTPHNQGADVIVKCFGAESRLQINLLGRFQIMNILASIGLVHAGGITLASALAAVNKLEGVPGRLETAAVTAAGAAVLVDYAHTPAALENMLKAVREHVSGRLIVVFGCGGDRDVGKRPLMAAAASKIGDYVVVTDDNPRSENPASIRQVVLAGIDKSRPYLEIGDRAAAIKAAIEISGAGDVVVIAGKGHEKEQIIGDVKIPFDDVAVAKNCVSEKA